VNGGADLASDPASPPREVPMPMHRMILAVGLIAIGLTLDLRPGLVVADGPGRPKPGLGRKGEGRKVQGSQDFDGVVARRPLSG